ncbi:MAG: glycosyltransferase family 39 protein [Planctomycetaceae bacterium]|jgi:hypothetical protein|nr:glycosyltransferase family 39 protein [Planctomycetaceae bacterium]
MFTRQQIYTLLILLSAGLMLGRILAVNRTDTILIQKNRIEQIPKQLADKEKRLRDAKRYDTEEDLQADLERTREKLLLDAQFELPVFSANDRSRWDTIRALVEPDMRVQRTVALPDGKQRTATVWYAIDKAQSVRGWDTIDMVKHDLPDQPGEGPQPGGGYLYSSKPPLLPTLMAIPYALMYRTSGGKLSLENEPFLVVRVTLIVCNFLPLVLCWFLLARLIERFGTTDWGRVFCVAFICFGTFISTFAVTLNNHFPAVVSVTIALYCVVRIIYDKETRWWLFVLAGLFGAFAVACEKPALLFCVLIALWLLCYQFRRTLLLFVPAALLVAGAHFATNYAAHQTLLPAYSQRAWYFYQYERGTQSNGKPRVLDSYWQSPAGLDRGEENHSTYVFHSTLGHHGLFSLTPVWGLSFIGLGIWLFDRRYRNMAAIILFTSLVVFLFYMALPLQLRNYGGNTSALRWLFWLAPLWSVPLVAAADWCSRKSYLRAVALMCLIVSAMSAAYPTWNPWTMPWAYNLLEYIK